MNRYVRDRNIFMQQLDTLIRNISVPPSHITTFYIQNTNLLPLFMGIF